MEGMWGKKLPLVLWMWEDIFLQMLEFPFVRHAAQFQLCFLVYLGSFQHGTENMLAKASLAVDACEGDALM